MSQESHPPLLSLLVGALLAVGCSGTRAAGTQRDASAAAGGSAANTGGKTSTGGQTASGGSTGGAPAGGASGGSTSTGGVVPTGGGGVRGGGTGQDAGPLAGNAGGTTGGGGNSSSGGTVGTGGAGAGRTSTGGAATGGAVSGGVVGTGGTGSGGTGGTGTGGTSTGGTGGAAAGGSVSTGGTRTGGNVGTGGNGTGGASTGGAGGTAACAVTPAVRTLLTDVETRLAFLATNTADWWLTHGVDASNGGFYGTLNAQGTSVTPRDKGLIQETRHLWAFSIYYERRGALAAAKAAADSTYQFLVSHMRDASDGEFYFKVNETGTSVVDSKKQLYAEGFAIYALAEYGQVFNLQAAKDYALACFRHMDARAHDATYGGYDQRNDSVSMPSGAEKETNTHIHLMEAFTALYRATSDATVGARLNEMIDVVAKHLLQPTNYVAQYFKVDWTPTGSVIVSYGHDIETTWLLLDAARAAARDTEAGLLAAALAMGKHSSERGFNATTGAYNYEGVPNTTTVTNTEHIWWVEFESLSGNYWLYRLTCDPVYLTRLESTLKWIEARRDPTYGEWYWGNLPNGSVGPHGTNKGDEWKASYHNLRALMFAGDWVHGTLN